MSGLGLRHAQEDEADVGHGVPEPVDGAHQRDGVEPVVDATAPHHHGVVGADGGEVSAQHGPGAAGGSAGAPKGTTSIRRRKRRVVVVDARD